jgi:helicase MOV-10
VETIRQLVFQDGTRRILACAPSNSAADIIADRLRPLGVSELFRLVAPSREPKLHTKELLQGRFVLLNAEGENFILPLLGDLLKFRVIVCTCVSSFWLRALGLQRGHFSHIFVDEAGQAYESETTIPIKFLASNGTNVVLSGDPKQLGPIVRSDIAKTLRMSWSFLDRLMAREPYQFLSESNSNQAKGDRIPRIDGTGITYVTTTCLRSVAFLRLCVAQNCKIGQEFQEPSFHHEVSQRRVLWGQP